MTRKENRNNCVLGRGALILCTLIWGTSFVILKNTLDAVPTYFIIAIRFTGAALLMLLIGYKDIKKLNWEYLKGGVTMGSFLFVAYAFQTMGLVHTTPGKNAFLTTTYCVIVPFMYWIIAKKRPDKFNIIAAMICLAGVGFVSLNKDLTINIGDILTICGGIFFAAHIISTNKHVHGKSIPMLTMIQFATVGILGWLVAPFTAVFPHEFSTTTVWSLVYLSVMCSAACFTLQTIGQKYTPPSSTALIMTLESVFGAIISIAFFGEILSVQIVVGFVLIFAAVIISESKLSFLKPRKKQIIVAEVFE